MPHTVRVNSLCGACSPRAAFAQRVLRAACALVAGRAVSNTLSEVLLLAGNTAQPK